MIHYKHINHAELADKMLLLPKEFSKKTKKNILAKALGATLYMPANRENIAFDIINQKYENLTTIVIDLEDALEDHLVEQSEQQILKELNYIEDAIKKSRILENEIPLLFIRIRNPEHLIKIIKHHDKLNLITGFVLPKFSLKTAINYLKPINDINKEYHYNFYAMPILEGKEIIYKENRIQELLSIKQILDCFSDIVLNVRIGGTDFSGLYSIRRSIDTTIYDVAVVRDCISDIMNIFNRAEDNYVISGVVWEFFSNHNRLLKSNLRETPFVEESGNQGKLDRKSILDASVDGFIKEIIYDKTNGIIGKTIIHPSHISYVNALQAVTEEEYIDACMILNQKSGVKKSSNGNRMNEMKPHLNWAKKVIEKSEVYGVLKNGYNYNSLF